MVVIKWGETLLLFFSHSSYSPVDPQFAHSKTIWAAGIPSKVQMFTQLVAHGKVNTCDLLQRRRPNQCLSPSWCVLCKKNDEPMNHILMHCPYSNFIWSKVWAEFGLRWVFPKTAAEFLLMDVNIEGDATKSKAL